MNEKRLAAVQQKAELILIRHGTTLRSDCLNGRTDVALSATPAPVALSPSELWVSPAVRARQTAAGLFGACVAREDARLWEQDFGVWDGKPLASLPDVGDLEKRALADLAAEGGESFAAMVARVTPALVACAARACDLGGPVVIVAHAGTARAALALALGDVPGALAFEVPHLAATRLRCFPGGGLAIRAVNEVLV